VQFFFKKNATFFALHSTLEKGKGEVGYRSSRRASGTVVDVRLRALLAARGPSWRIAKGPSGWRIVPGANGPWGPGTRSLGL